MTYLKQSYRQVFRRLHQSWLLLALLLVPAYSDAQSLTLIVNPQLDVTAISRNKARGIFSMRLREWSDGTPIVVYVLPDKADLHRDFVQNILTMFPHQLRRHWDRYVYTGIGQAPIEVSDVNEMITRVHNTAGAIGYIREETADANIRTIQLN
jgi:ABC-type phosphate transport system substrate-binding protein